LTERVAARVASAAKPLLFMGLEAVSLTVDGKEGAGRPRLTKWKSFAVRKPAGGGKGRYEYSKSDLIRAERKRAKDERSPTPTLLRATQTPSPPCWLPMGTHPDMGSLFRQGTRPFFWRL
jgi:hypothetical protein